MRGLLSFWFLLCGVFLESRSLVNAVEPCPDQFVQFHFDAEKSEPTCIAVLREENSWLLQRQQCISMGSDLAITTTYLQQQLAVYLTQLQDAKDISYFMGALDQGLEEEDWVWIGGDPMDDVAWSNGHPQENDRDCGTLCPQEYLYCSDFCTENYRALCQIGTPNNPVSFPPEITTRETTEQQTTTPETTEAPTTAPDTTEEPTTTPEATEEPSTTPVATEEPTTTPDATEEPTTAPVTTEQQTTTFETTEELTTLGITSSQDTTLDIIGSTIGETTTEKTVEPYPTSSPYDVDCPLLYSKWYLDEQQQNPVCLKFISDAQAWNTHRALCLDDNARLLERLSPYLTREIADYLPSIPSYQYEEFFVGANDIEIEGSWSWNDYSPIYSGVWAVDEPSGGDVENCGCLCPEGFFFLCDCQCSTLHYAICISTGTPVLQ